MSTLDSLLGASFCLLKRLNRNIDSVRVLGESDAVSVAVGVTLKAERDGEPSLPKSS